MTDPIFLAASYAVGLALAALLNARDLAHSPQKKQRYQALPLRYRSLCWFVVVPLFTAAPLFLYGNGQAVAAAVSVLVLAPASLIITEVLAVRWYRRSGLL